MACAQASAAGGYAFGVNGLDFSLSSYRLESNGELRHLGHRPMGKSPPAVVVHPSGRFVFALSKTLNNIAVYRLEHGSGELTPVPGSPFAAQATSPFGIAFHPSGRYVYVAARFSGVAAYAFDEQTGALTPLPGSPFPAQERTRSLVMHPSGLYLYAVNGYSNSVSAYRIDPASGLLSPLPNSPYSVGEMGEINHSALGMGDVPAGAGGIPYDIAIDPEGRFIYVANWASASVSVFQIDAKSGQPTLVPGSPFFADFSPYRLTTDPSGRFLYVVHFPTHKISVMAIDAKSGRLTHISGSPFDSGGKGPVALTFSDDGRRLYVTHYKSNEIALLDVSPESGALTLRQRIETRIGPWDLALFEDVGDEAPQAFAPLLAAQGDAGLTLFDTTKAALSAPLKTKVDGSAQAVAVSPDGRFVYVADTVKGTLRTFQRAVDSGVSDGLQPVADGVVNVGHGPVDLMIDVNGWYLYAANRDGTLLAWRLDSDSGIPRSVMRAPVKVGKNPVVVVQDPAMRYTFVVNAGSNNISVFYAYNSTMPVVIDSKKYGSPFAAGTQPVALAVEPNGRYAYVANAGSSDISAYRIHHQTGALSALPGSPFKTAKRPMDLVVHPSGRWLYVANQDAATISIHGIEKGLGALAAGARELKLPVRPKALRLDAAGKILWVLSENGRRLLRLAIDSENGELTLLKVETLKQPIEDLTLVTAE